MRYTSAISVSTHVNTVVKRRLSEHGSMKRASMQMAVTNTMGRMTLKMKLRERRLMATTI